MSTIDSVYESSDCMSLTQTIIDDLKADLRGEVLQPQDVGYDDARTIWNAMINRYPGLIIRCEGVSDVIAAVNLARNNNLLVSVKGGGHTRRPIFSLSSAFVIRKQWCRPARIGCSRRC